MFSGIIEHVGAVQSLEAGQSMLRLAVATGFDDLALGESVAVNGVCLTVAGFHDADSAGFWLSEETQARSNLGSLRPGDVVNLERAVTPATRLSGHMVQGHVDGTADCTLLCRDGAGARLALSLPAALRPYCVEKGSIAIDGISLTLNKVGDLGRDGRFLISLNIIPHTWNHTNLRFLTKGRPLNVEVDIFAKYVEQLCPIYLRQSHA